MSDWDFILAPATVTVRFKLDEVAIFINSLRLLNAAQGLSGLGEWIVEVAEELSEERLQINSMVADVLASLHCELADSVTTFAGLMENFKSVDDKIILEGLIGWLRHHDDYPGDEAILTDEDAFVAKVHELAAAKLEKKGIEFDEKVWRERYYYITHPDEFREIGNDHLNFMWNNYLEAEWRRTKPMLEEAVEAHSQQDYSGLTGFEAIEAVTGRNMRSSEDIADALNKVDVLTFIPSLHIGPYIGWGPGSKNEQVFYFGARPPKDAAVKSKALNRSELLVRLNALADETRLKILELLTQHEELCAQDFITELDLSQSSASRHLRQLTASGYLSERRRDVAKCYSINTDRVDDTIQALKDFLRKA